MMDQYNDIQKEKVYLKFINEANYNILSNLTIEDEKPWNMRNNLKVNSNINNYFKRDKTLESLINIFNEKKYEEFKIADGLLDHDYCVRFKCNKKDYYNFKHIYGILTFPYMSFETLKDIISSWGTEFWNLYIINPALMKYAEGSLGLFITPKYNGYLQEINGISETLTGYELFYLWTDDSEINPIIQNKEPDDINIWLENLSDPNFPIMYKKIVNFWFNNKEKGITSESLESSYFEFNHKMPYYPPSLMGITLKGIDFELFNPSTGWTTGKCNELSFDLASFNCIYVDHNEIVFTDKMIDEFKNGDFELKIS